MAKSKGFGKKWKKEQERLKDFPLFNIGKRLVSVISANIEKKEKGQNLIVDYKFLKGEDKGKTLKIWYMFDHESDDAENHAARHLSSLCDAIKIKWVNFEDPKMLLKKKLVIDIGVQPAEGNYKAKNKINGYFDKSEPLDIHKDKKKGKKSKKPF